MRLKSKYKWSERSIHFAKLEIYRKLKMTVEDAYMHGTRQYPYVMKTVWMSKEEAQKLFDEEEPNDPA